MAHDVFISYAANDKPVADAVCAQLERAGVRCWIAPRDILPGQEYGAALVAAIEGSRIVALVLSRSSAASPHVLREIERAVHMGVAILPLRIDEVRPSGSLEYFISTTHWLDALTPPLEQHLARLAAAAKVLLQEIPSTGRTIPTPEGVRRPQSIPTLAFERDPCSSVDPSYEQAATLSARASEHASLGRAKVALAVWGQAAALCRNANESAPSYHLFAALRLEMCRQAARAARKEVDRLRAGDNIDPAIDILEDVLKIFGDDLKTIGDRAVAGMLCDYLCDRGDAEMDAYHRSGPDARAAAAAQARSDFETALELDPRYDRARRGLAEICTVEGRDARVPDEGIQLLRKALELQPDSDATRANLAGQLWFKAMDTVQAHSGRDLRDHIDNVINLLEEAVTFAGTNIGRGAVPSLVQEAVTLDPAQLGTGGARANPDKVSQLAGGQKNVASLIQYLEDLARLYMFRERIRGS